MDFEAMLRAARASAARARADPGPGDAGAAPGRPLGAAIRRLDVLPGEVAYAQGFVGTEEAAQLAAAVEARPFVALHGRLLQNYGGVPHLSGTICEPLPEFLRGLAIRLRESGAFGHDPPIAPDQALVNKYGPSQGIAAHNDGENFKPRAAIVSLNSYAVLRFFRPEAATLDSPEGPSAAAKSPSRGHEVGSVLLEPNSLLVFAGAAYEELTHAIDPVETESIEGVANWDLLSPELRAAGQIKREERLSLTLRNVARVQCVVDLEHDYVAPDIREEMARRTVWWRRAISQ